MANVKMESFVFTVIEVGLYRYNGKDIAYNGKDNHS